MKSLLIYALLILGLNSCVLSRENSIEENWNITAYWEIEQGDSVIVVDESKLKAEMNIPLDILAEDYSVVKLDKKAQLTHRMSNVFISDNFIAISCYDNHPLKLFKKDGTFIRDIGSLGSGNEQYDCIHDIQIDEKNNKVYILSAYLLNSDRILVYNLQGAFLHEIPLVNEVRYGGSFKLDILKNEITVMNTNTKQLTTPFLIWVQDIEGNLIQGIPADRRKEDNPITSTISLNHTENMEMFLLHNRNSDEEHLFHYNKIDNRLVPKLRIETKADCIFVYELPYYYIIENVSYEYNNTPKFIIEKKSLKGCRFTGFVTPEGLLLEQYNILFQTHDGYFSLMEQKSQILKRIQKTNKKNLTKERLEGLKRLQKMIDEDEDNEYLLFMAKFKK